jgi:Domain of unknown function (DUF1918)
MARGRENGSIGAMATPTTTAPRAGDVIEVQGLPGYGPRRGQIVEILGRPGQPHYRVRWDEEHESMYFPADGALHVIPTTHRRRSRS